MVLRISHSDPRAKLRRTMDIINNKYTKTVLMVIVIAVIVWLGSLLLDKMGGHINGGVGVGSVSTSFSAGTVQRSN